MSRLCRPGQSQRLRRRPRGYVLLTVLLLLTIAAAALAGVCRVSMLKAVRASRAEEDLQRRWAVTSCRSALLSKAEALLTREDAAEVRRDVRLGNVSLTLVFGDEQAKANVNLLYREGGLAGAERGARALANGEGVAVELRPLPVPAKGDADTEETPAPAFESFGQIFPHARPASLIESRGPTPPPASVLTCWGDGSLNYRRASAAALREACGRHLNGAQVGQLLQIRQKEPRLESGEALDRLKLSPTAREALDDRLVDESSCHSLWLISRSGGRSWYDLAVDDRSGGEGGGVRVFSW